MLNSLYVKFSTPSGEDLQQIQVFVIPVQKVGTGIRFYTVKMIITTCDIMYAPALLPR